MADLSQNYNRLKAQFGINLPIEGLFWNIQDAVDLANAVGAPHTPLKILNAAYHLVFQSGIFSEDFFIWKRRCAPYKTWP